MIIREYKNEDKKVINNWPKYSYGDMQIDYAVRENGWIEQYLKYPNDKIYIGMENSEILGFTILHYNKNSEVEFLIMIKSTKIGQGYGKKLSIMTLNKCFTELDLEKVSLAVRKDNKKAMELYDRLGFYYTGGCIRKIEGVDIEFFNMELSRSLFQKSF